MRDSATTRTRAVAAARATDPGAPAMLDDVSEQLGEVLRHADELLAEWARFSAQVRTTVDAEVDAIGGAVGTAIDGAVERAVERTGATTEAAVARAIETRIGAQLGTLAAELARLEQRARSAQRAVAEDRGKDRRLSWIVLGGVCVANLLLAIVLLRGPGQVPAPPAASTQPDVTAPIVAPPGDGSAAVPDRGSASAGSASVGSASPGSTSTGSASVSGAVTGTTGTTASSTTSSTAAGVTPAATGDGSGAAPSGAAVGSAGAGEPHLTPVKAGTVPRPKHSRSH